MEVVHEISGAIIAITLVMTSVFIPVTFIPGAVGTFYRVFGITMATSIILSGLVALTLTPVLCAMILKPHAYAGNGSHGNGNGIDPNTRDTGPDFGTGNGRRRRGLGVKLLIALGGLLVLGGITYVAYELWGPVGFLLILLPFVRGPFERAVERVTGGYAAIVRRIATRRTLTMAVVGGFAAGIVVVNTQLATGFIPGEDQGIIYAVLQTPPGSTLEYTNAKSQELEKLAKEIEEVTSVTSLAGLRSPDRRPRLELGDLHHQPEELVRPQANRTPDHRGSRGEMPPAEHEQREARVLRTTRGPRLRHRRGYLHARPRHDVLHELPAARRSDRQVHSRPEKA
jgi:HAE1 family hydrophobic/amphiphilic exporter-1